MYEVIRCDSIDEPQDVINKQIISNIRLPFFAYFYRILQRGQAFEPLISPVFSSFCVLLTLEGSGRVTYRNKTKSVGPGRLFLRATRGY